MTSKFGFKTSHEKNSEDEIIMKHWRSEVARIDEIIKEILSDFKKAKNMRESISANVIKHENGYDVAYWRLHNQRGESYAGIADVYIEFSYYYDPSNPRFSLKVYAGGSAYNYREELERVIREVTGIPEWLFIARVESGKFIFKNQK